MKLKKLNALAVEAGLTEEAEINFIEPNFGGKGEDIDEYNISIENGQLLVRPPTWEPVD